MKMHQTLNSNFLTLILRKMKYLLDIEPIKIEKNYGKITINTQNGILKLIYQ
jgi:hypothetical protein